MPKAKKEAKVKKIKSSGKGEKLADMSATAVVIDDAVLEKQLQEIPEVSPSSAKATEGKRVPRARGKNYKNVKKLVDKTKTYSPAQAFELLKKISFAKFGGSVEVHLNVVDKGISGEVKLPHFEGKALKVAIFNEEIMAEIKDGKINFDVLLATPADMPLLMPLAKVLGPKGLLPNPKNGTITPDPQKTAGKFSGSALRYKTEKDFPQIHTVIGKINQPAGELVANFEAFIKAINPKNIKKSYVKSTMSPSIRVSLT